MEDRSLEGTQSWAYAPFISSILRDDILPTHPARHLLEIFWPTGYSWERDATEMRNLLYSLDNGVLLGRIQNTIDRTHPNAAQQEVLLGTWDPVTYSVADIQNRAIEELLRYYEIGNPLHNAHVDTINRMMAIGNRLVHAIHMIQILCTQLHDRYANRPISDQRDFLNWCLDLFPNGIVNLNA